MYGTTRVNNNSRSSTISDKFCQSKAKAMIILFIWSLTTFMSFLELGLEKTFYFDSYEAIVLLFVPIGGYIGDVFLGRYRVIKYSMRILWVILIFCDVIITFDVLHSALTKVLPFIAGIGAVASVAIIANIFQFGIDQIPDASSTQIISFIHWGTWSFFLANSIFLLSTSCICGLYSDYIPLFLQPLLCTVSILCDCFLSHWLIKEPVKQNPMKLIYQVLRYAAKNKYPRMRSAFTYWEDKPYTRIDLGKRKYGGPFTTEQVEDVKTFFRVLGLLAAAFPIMCLMIGINLLSMNKLYLQFKNNHSVVSCQNYKSTMEYIKYCLNYTIVQFASIFSIVIILPVIRFIIIPLLRKCPHFVNVGIFHRFMASIFFLLLFEVIILSVEVYYLHSPPANVSCILNISKDLPDAELFNLDMAWLIFPQIFLGMSIFLSLSSAVEFINAQAPCSMRGFLLGIFLLLYGFAFGTASFFSRLIPDIANKYIQTTSEAANCSIWYFAVVLLVTIVLLCGGLLSKKFYKPRRRDEDVHNEQKFAVEYFDKYLQRNR